MAANDTLIFGNSYVTSPERAWLVSVWAKLTRRLNPDNGILIVDSPAVPSYFPELADDIKVFRFKENVGHLMTGGKDGAGRAWAEGVRFAIEGGYKSLAFIETDVLLSRPVSESLNEMYAAGKGFAQVPGDPYPWNESGLWFADVGYLREIDFVNRYVWDFDWSGDKKGVFPEFELTKMMQNDLHMLVLPGRRNDDGLVTVDNARSFYWITHSSREVYKAFLQAHGYGDLI